MSREMGKENRDARGRLADGQGVGGDTKSTYGLRPGPARQQKRYVLLFYWRPIYIEIRNRKLEYVRASSALFLPASPTLSRSLSLFPPPPSQPGADKARTNKYE